jgi:hypothetical protein
MAADFFSVLRTARNTSAGAVELPILYQEASNVIAFFGSHVRGATALLDGTGLEPAFVYGEKAITALSFYEYRRTSIGSYNEVATAIVAKKVGDRAGLGALLGLLGDPRKSRIGFWVVDLPVTTEAADIGGRELWGYPKFVTRIDFSLARRALKCGVATPTGEAPICTLAGTMGPSIRSPALSFLTWTQLGGKLTRTPIDVRGLTRAHLRGDVALRVGDSRHRMADNLRTLGLDGAAPMVLLVTEHFQSLLHAGTTAFTA